MSYISIALFRCIHIIGFPRDDDNETWFVRRFTKRNRYYSWLLVGVLYPFFLVWTLVGTFWYVEILAKSPDCFEDPVHAWYIVTWIFLCYIWLIVYATLISISGVLYFRTRTLEAQMESLLAQYPDRENAPTFSPWRSSGLEPSQILDIPYRDIHSSEDS